MAIGAVFAAFAVALAAPAFAATLALPVPILMSWAIAFGAVSMAIGAGLWALSEQQAATRLRRNLRTMAGKVRAAIGARDALLAAGREALIVWGREGAEPFSYRGAEALLDSCLAGPDATVFSQALDALGDKGVPFNLTVRDARARKLATRGRAVGGMAAVWLEDEAQPAERAIDFAAILDALPIPVWLRGRTLSLKWGNRAFLTATNTHTLEVATANQAALDKSERDLASAARSEGHSLESKRFAVIGGQRRALEFNHVPLEEGQVAGSVVDVTDVANAEARLQQHVDAHQDTLDKLATAVAIFGREQKLTFHNRAFVALWNLPESWLDTHPTDGEILDRLREGRKLPEQRDYQAWKRQRLSLYEQSDYLPEELWHVPGGKTLRVVAQPHPFGGLIFLYEDVTEKLALESSYNTLIKVQTATLDTLKEGVAVFGPDGRLKLYNASFARIWELGDGELAGEPHARAIARVCAARFGEELVWDELVAAIASGADGKRDWGEIARKDQKILALALSPLPDGATLLTFADVTDRHRIESALRDRNEALVAADHLKSQFIRHVSYELRTPLNPIKGYAEMLSAGGAGPLTAKQREYVSSIIASSQTLEGLVDDILDLALVESGQLRLELERLNLYKVLSGVYAHALAWAMHSQREVRLDCAQNAGEFVADRRRIQQVVVYLLSNALQFTPEGGTIVIGGEIRGEDVQIYVSDTGPGIAPDLSATVFDRFEAKPQSGQRGGAGLGLTLVKSFIELHRGWVEIDSKPGRGTIVRCHLPRRIEAGTAQTVA